MRIPLVAVLLSACVPHPHTTPPPPEPFAYARELGEMFQAIDDLSHADLGSRGGDEAAHQLEAAFKSTCTAWHVSCDRATWAQPWTNRGQVGKLLAHALTALDRIYAVWSMQRDSRYDDALQTVDDVRRKTRELLFASEHPGISPDHRLILMAEAELRYARSLLGDGPPPANMPWDAATTRTVLEESVATLVAQYPDNVHHYEPDPRDFSNISYVGHTVIANNLIERAVDDIEHDKASDDEPHGGPLQQLELALRDARNELSHPLGFALTPATPARENATVLDNELAALVIARNTLSRPNIGHSELERVSHTAEASVKDAFLSATTALGLPADESRWAPSHYDGYFVPMELVEEADAAFSLRPELAEARRLLAPAFPAMIRLQQIQSTWEPDGKTYEPLYKQLQLARSMLDVQAPPDDARNVQSVLADLDAAIADIDAKHWDTSVKRDRFHRLAPRWPYQIRLIVAHDGIERALRETEHNPGKAPRAALAKARDAVELLGHALQPPRTARR